MSGNMIKQQFQISITNMLICILSAFCFIIAENQTIGIAMAVNEDIDGVRIIYLICKFQYKVIDSLQGYVHNASKGHLHILAESLGSKVKIPNVVESANRNVRVMAGD